jgi:cytochrome P450
MGPDEVAVDGDPGWEDVYALRRNGKEEFKRDPAFFDISTGQDVSHPSIFVTDRAGHSRQRRILAHAFSQSAMYEQEPVIKHYVDIFISRIHDFASAGTAIDIVKWFNFTTFDIIGELTFGESFNCLQQNEMHPWVALIFDAVYAGEIIRFFLKHALTRPIVTLLLGKTLREKRADHKALTAEKTARRVALGPEGLGTKDFMWYVDLS